MAILDVTQAPYNAVGDGVADDGAAVQSALSAATAGDLVYFPGGTYRTTQGLTFSASPGGIYGDGVDISTIKYDNVTPDDLMTITGAGLYCRIEGLGFDGSGQATNCLCLQGSFAHYSSFKNFRLLSPLEAGVKNEAGLTSCAFHSISSIGGMYGFYNEESTNISGVMFSHLRISNTLNAAVYIRNPGNSLHAFSIFHPTLEGNRGAALDFGGGMQCRIYGGHFEQNGTTTGLPDILMGRFSSSTAPLCELHLFGVNFSSKGAAQTNVRIRFEESGAQLRMYGIRNTSSLLIDMNDKSSGSFIKSIASSSIFGLENGPDGKVYIFDEVIEA